MADTTTATPTTVAMEDDKKEVKVEEKKVEVVAPLDPQTALKSVLRTALIHDGLARGLKEAVKALDRREANLCILALDCDEPSYSKLIGALCHENNIPIIRVEEKQGLGEWAGLCRYAPDGKAIKVVACSCVVVRSWGEESEARHYLMEHLSKFAHAHTEKKGGDKAKPDAKKDDKKDAKGGDKAKGGKDDKKDAKKDDKKAAPKKK